MTTPALGKQSEVARPPQWIRSGRWLLEGTMYMMLWGWAIAIVLVAAILAIVNRYTGIEMSGFAFSHQGMLWYPFSIAVMFAAMHLPVHVANGMTRRSFIKAAIFTNVVVGIANAAFTMVGLLVERVIYNQLGWFHGRTDGEGMDLFENGIWSYALGLALLFVGGMLSGMIVGISYYRFGAWATLMLPLTLFPIFGTAILGLDQASQWAPWDVELLGYWPGASLVGVLVLAVSCAAFALMVRRIPIDTGKG